MLAQTQAARRTIPVMTGVMEERGEEEAGRTLLRHSGNVKRKGGGGGGEDK